MALGGYCAGIQTHYELLWGPSKVHLLSSGPWRDLPKEFAVLEFPPHPKRTLWTYATRCMSAPDDKSRIELHLFAPTQAPSLVLLLTAVAHFHRTGARLDLGHTVNFGQPWLDRSVCSYGLISRPYLDGPDLENGGAIDAPVRYYWLIPISAEEREFKIARGLDELEHLFEAGPVDYANPARASLAPKPS